MNFSLAFVLQGLFFIPSDYQGYGWIVNEILIFPGSTYRVKDQVKFSGNGNTYQGSFRLLHAGYRR
jgi:hypothetical protein